MPRVSHVKKARKDQGKCGRCGKDLLKGEPYRWFKFRFGSKKIRCMETACGFKNSELTSSDKLSRLYGAQESAEDQLGHGVKSWEDAQSVLEELANEATEVADEYRESADAIREHFEESPTADECEEKADEVEAWANEIETIAQELEDSEDPWEEAYSVVGECPI